MDVIIDTDERLDTVVGTDFKLIQKIDGTAYAIDSLLLANFVRLPDSVMHVADLGSGSGILAFLLKYRCPALRISGFEIQAEYCNLALRNLDLNRQFSDISFENIDIREIPSRVLPESFDMVISNPPYFAKGSGRLPAHPGRALARHELAGDIGDFIETACYLLPYGSSLNMIVPANRFYEILEILKSRHFGLKRLQFIMPKTGRQAHLALFEAEKFYNGRHESLPDICIHQIDGNFGEEVNCLINQGLNRKS